MRTKVKDSIIDTGILDWFRNQVNEAGGGNYQTLINEALGEHIQTREGLLEKSFGKSCRLLINESK